MTLLLLPKTRLALLLLLKVKLTLLLLPKVKLALLLLPKMMLVLLLLPTNWRSKIHVLSVFSSNKHFFFELKYLLSAQVKNRI